MNAFRPIERVNQSDWWTGAFRPKRRNAIIGAKGLPGCTGSTVQKVLKRPSLAQMRLLPPLEQSPRSHYQTIVWPMTDFETRNQAKNWKRSLSRFPLLLMLLLQYLLLLILFSTFQWRCQSCSFQGRSQSNDDMECFVKAGIHQIMQLALTE